MQLLTNSRRNCFNDCRRKHFYIYEQGYKPIKLGENLKVGINGHAALEQWWKGEDGLKAAMEYINSLRETDYNVYEIAKLRCLINAYHQKWMGMKPSVLSVEPEFTAQLLNPETEFPSKNFMLAGKIDVITATSAGPAIVEHKFTSEDIGPESDYWNYLTIDGQISGYYVGALSLGYEPVETIYDVIKIPRLRPSKATPPELRKYTKEGKLYANQRATDETVDEYSERLTTEIMSNIDIYFVRRRVVRMKEELVDYYYDMWQTAKDIRENQLSQRWPRNPRNCYSRGRCPFIGVCTRTESIDDTTLFEKVENVHSELKLAENFLDK